MTTTRLRAIAMPEVLAVLAVLAVLLLVSVPNFRDAQARSHVADVRSDHAVIGRALESYIVDHVVPPRHPVESGLYFWYRLHSPSMTTPVAYLDPEILLDPFAPTDRPSAGILPSSPAPTYFYVNWEIRDRQVIHGDFPVYTPFNNPQWYGAVKQPRVPELGSWEIASLGPTYEFQRAIDPSTRWGHYFLLYDPTNGTISDGAVMRSQAHPHGVPTSGYIANGLPGE